MIHIDGLIKSFRVFERREGLRGALLDLVHREYRELKAVDGVSFSIRPGEMVGCLGPNGAGKSTTLKILTGILVPTSGRVEVGGFVPWRDRRRYVGSIGAVFGQRSSLWWDLAVVESFTLLARIYGVPDADCRERLEYFDAKLGIGRYLHTPARKLSLGERMRCDLVAALLHRPKVLFLDEPTIGLDIVAKAAVRNFLKEANRTLGTTMILTTHDLSDVEELCPRVVILDKGRLLYDGALEAIRRRYDTQAQVLVDFTQPVPREALTGISPGSGVAWEALDGNRWRAVVDRKAMDPVTLTRALLGRFAVADLSLVPTPVEEIIRRLYQEGGS
jgi:ABC-2 type transport system ATP-binding protein